MGVGMVVVWVVGVVALVVGPCTADYVWDGEEWRWQDTVVGVEPGGAGEQVEGSGGASYTGR